MEWLQLTKEQIEYALNCTKGTLAHEGLELPPEIEKIYKKMLENEITISQAEQEILNYHGIRRSEK